MPSMAEATRPPPKRTRKELSGVGRLTCHPGSHSKFQRLTENYVQVKSKKNIQKKGSDMYNKNWQKKEQQPKEASSSNNPKQEEESSKSENNPVEEAPSTSNVTQVKMSAAGERALLNQVNDIRSKLASASTDIQKLIDTYKTLPDAISEASTKEYQRLVSFKEEFEEFAKGYHPIARLRDEDARTLKGIAQVLTFNNFKAATDTAQSALHEEEEAAKKRIKAQGEQIEEQVKNGKTEIDRQVYDAKTEVRNSIEWLQSMTKHKFWWILGTILIVLCVLMGGVSSCMNGERKQAAAEQIIQDANYWDVFEYYYPQGANNIKQNYERLQDKRTTKEAQRYINAK